MNLFFINSKQKEDRWRTILNDTLMSEAKRITTVRQIREVEFGNESLVLMSESFGDVYGALVSLMEKEGRMTVIALSKIPMPRQINVSAEKKIIFLTIPVTEKEVRDTILTAAGRKKKEAGTWFWGTDAEMLRVRNVLLRQKWSKLPIHITGEIGTGKSRLAEWIAKESGLEDRFVPVNCSGLSDQNLGMDKLFGHIKWAYTDGKNRRRGLIGKADGGILFLDEVQDLPQAAISNLLTVLETGHWRPIGSDDEEESHFRLITASSASREELYRKLGAALMSRIEGITISLPPLRERKHDIPALMERLQEKLSPAAREYQVLDMGPWIEYGWPNNVRELLYKMEYFGCSGILPEEMNA